MNNDVFNPDTQNIENNEENVDNVAKVEEAIEADVYEAENCPCIETTAFVEPRFDERPAKSDFSKIGFGYLVFSGATLLISFVLQIVVMIVSKEFYESHLFRNLITPVSMYLFALPLLIGFFRSVKPRPPVKKRISLGAWMLYLVVGFGVMYIGAYVSNYLMSIISAIVGYDYINALETIVGGGSLWVTAIFAVVIAPIGEELVFRKLLIDRTGKYGCFISALLSGLIFGLMHANLFQVVYATALGFILGYLYYTTGRIIYTIGIHAVINFVGSIVSSLLTRGLEGLEMATLEGEALVEFLAEHALQLAGVLLYSAFTYAAMIAAIVLPIVFRKKLKLQKGEIEIPSAKRGRVIFLNTGMICMLLFYAFEMILSLIPS